MRHKKLMFLGASFLVIGLLGAVLIWPFEKPSGLVWDKGFKYLSIKAKKTYAYDQQIPADAASIKELEISVLDVENVKITEGKKFKVQATTTSAEETIKVNFQNGKLSVTSDAVDHAMINIGVISRSTEILIEIPKTNSLSVIDADNAYGGLTFENLTGINNILVSSHNGDINFDNVSAKSVRSVMQTGYVSFVNSEFDALTASNRYGNIDMANSVLTTDSKISSQDGYIDIKKSKLPKFYVETTYGDKEIAAGSTAQQTTKDKAKLIITNRSGTIAIN